MSDMRETLMGIVAREVMDAGETADAIIAAMPDMVRPLQWEGGEYYTGDDEGYMAEAKDHVGNWYLVEDHVSGYFASVSTDEGWSDGPHETADAAKAAAQAHHTAAILSAFGVQGGEA